MTVVLVSGGLTFVIGLLIVRPFWVPGGHLHVRAHAPDDDRRRELLRQLRDLDDDLAAGKLTQDDHARLRDPVEREAAAVLRRKSPSPADGTREAAPGTRSGSATHGPLQRPDAGESTRRRNRPTVTLLALAAAAAGIAILLVNEVSARHQGQTITGNSVPGAAPVTASQNGSAPASPSAAGRKQPTRQQLAAVAAAEAQVKQNPRDVSAHLALAEAFASAGASQQAAVEYLAVTRLDPSNPEANTSLALLAFEIGHAAQAKSMVDRVLTANPRYPEALYVRGLIDLMGLRLPKTAERDFSAYLAAAPFGSHRIAAATLLALAQSQAHR